MYVQYEYDNISMFNSFKKIVGFNPIFDYCSIIDRDIVNNLNNREKEVLNSNFEIFSQFCVRYGLTPNIVESKQ